MGERSRLPEYPRNRRMEDPNPNLLDHLTRTLARVRRDIVLDQNDWEDVRAYVVLQFLESYREGKAPASRGLATWVHWRVRDALRQLSARRSREGIDLESASTSGRSDRRDIESRALMFAVMKTLPDSKLRVLDAMLAGYANGESNESVAARLGMSERAYLHERKKVRDQIRLIFEPAD